MINAPVKPNFESSSNSITKIENKLIRMSKMGIQAYLDTITFLYKKDQSWAEDNGVTKYEIIKLYNIHFSDRPDFIVWHILTSNYGKHIENNAIISLEEDILIGLKHQKSDIRVNTLVLLISLLAGLKEWNQDALSEKVENIIDTAKEHLYDSLSGKPLGSLTNNTRRIHETVDRYYAKYKNDINKVIIWGSADECKTKVTELYRSCFSDRPDFQAWCILAGNYREKKINGNVPQLAEYLLSGLNHSDDVIVWGYACFACLFTRVAGTAVIAIYRKYFRSR